jgi:hypothetical protein
MAEVTSGASKTHGVRVAWRARLQLPTGVIPEVKVIEVSSFTVSVLCEQPLPADARPTLAILLPPVHPGEKATIASGPVKVLFQVLKQGSFLIHLQWLEVPANLKERIHNRLK